MVMVVVAAGVRPRVPLVVVCRGGCVVLAAAIDSAVVVLVAVLGA